MSTTPIPVPQQGQPSMSPESYAQYIQAAAAQQSNVTGLTQMGPNMGGPHAPVQHQYPQPGEKSARTFGPGEGAARKREAMGNLVKSAQGIAQQFGQMKQQRDQRQYEQVVGRFTQATQGVNQAQAQVQQGQQMLAQAAQMLKANPNDPEAHKLVQQGQQLTQSGQAALKQNQTIINDMANDPKQHKVITKAFGVDDKNANTPERAAAAQVLQKQMGVGGNAAGILSQLPQTQQLSPQAQGQQMARQAGVVGAPASGTAVLNAESRAANTAATEAGKNARSGAKDQLSAAFKGMKYEGDKLVPMTPEEISKNPVLSSKMDVQKSTQALHDAQAQLARARATALPEQVKAMESRVAALQGNLMMRQKEFTVKVAEEERKQLETSAKIGQAGSVTMPDGETKDISPITGGRPLQSWAQQTVVQTEDRLGQVNDLMQKLEPLKDVNQPGYLAADRLGYAMGIASENGKLGAEISNIELQRVVNAATILKGSSRAYAALSQAMIHTPNAWTDSPQMMYQKLQTIQRNLQDMQNDAILYGQKGQRSGEMPGSPKQVPKQSADDPLGILK